MICAGPGDAYTGSVLGTLKADADTQCLPVISHSIDGWGTNLIERLKKDLEARPPQT